MCYVCTRARVRTCDGTVSNDDSVMMYKYHSEIINNVTPTGSGALNPDLSAENTTRPVTLIVSLLDFFFNPEVPLIRRCKK